MVQGGDQDRRQVIKAVLIACWQRPPLHARDIALRSWNAIHQ